MAASSRSRACALKMSAAAAPPRAATVVTRRFELLRVPRRGPRRAARAPRPGTATGSSSTTGSAHAQAPGGPDRDARGGGQRRGAACRQREARPTSLCVGRLGLRRLGGDRLVLRRVPEVRRRERAQRVERLGGLVPPRTHQDLVALGDGERGEAREAASIRRAAVARGVGDLDPRVEARRAPPRSAPRAARAGRAGSRPAGAAPRPRLPRPRPRAVAASSLRAPPPPAARTSSAARLVPRAPPRRARRPPRPAPPPPPRPPRAAPPRAGSARRPARPSPRPSRRSSARCRGPSGSSTPSGERTRSTAWRTRSASVPISPLSIPPAASMATSPPPISRASSMTPSASAALWETMTRPTTGALRPDARWSISTGCTERTPVACSICQRQVSESHTVRSGAASAISANSPAPTFIAMSYFSRLRP